MAQAGKIACREEPEVPTAMNIANLQATLRHFAAEREWQPFHTLRHALGITALALDGEHWTEVMPPSSRRIHDATQSRKASCASVLMLLPCA